MIKTIFKRLTVILLTLAMVLGSVPAFFRLEVDAAMASGSVITSDHQEQQRQLAIDTLLYGVRGNNSLSVPEKALILHDRLVTWCEYDVDAITDGNQRYTADGVFINRIAVCQGYALAYQELLQAVGIYNLVCVSDDLNHAWNILLIDGEYYHVDCTWDDFLADQVGRVPHINFLVSDATFRSDRKDFRGMTHEGHDAYDFEIFRQGKTAPACTSTKYESAWWHRSNSEVQVIGSNIYWLDNSTGYIRRASDGANLLYVNTSWSYGQCYTRLDSDGNYLYYTKTDSIWRYNVNTGSNSSWHYPSGVTSSANLYEFTLETGIAFVGVKTNPWKETTTCTQIQYIYVDGYTGLHESNGYWWFLRSNNYTGLVPHSGGLYYVVPSGTDSYVDYSYTGLCHYKETTYYVKNGRVDDTYTGLYTWNGETYSIKQGYVDTLATGVQKHGGKYYYIKNGVVDTTKNGVAGGYLFSKGRQRTTYTGLYKNNGTWVHVSKGVVKSSYTGLSKYNGAWYLVKNGKLNTKYTGLYKYNGNWYYLTKGKWNTAFTGLTKYGSRTYYVYKGKLYTKYTGLYKYNGKWYYLAKGVVSNTYSGLAKSGSDYYLVKNGKINAAYTGLYKYGSTWHYIKGGEFQKTYTGLVKSGSKIYYVQNGKFNTGYSGLMKYGGRWYHISKGIVNPTYTGLSKYKGAWYLVKNGKLNTTYTGMYKAGSTWYYLTKGQLDTSRTGLYKYGSTWYYLQKGKQSTGTGLVKKDGIYYYVSKGVVNFNFTGIAQRGGERYYVKKGYVRTSVTDLILYNGNRYYVKNGKVQSSFTGLYKVNSKTWYFVENGVVNTECEGLVTTYSDNTSWLVRNGKVDFDYYGTWWYRSNGSTWKKCYIYGGKMY